jgi:hypothetical protein
MPRFAAAVCPRPHGARRASRAAASSSSGPSRRPRVVTVLRRVVASMPPQAVGSAVAPTLRRYLLEALDWDPRRINRSLA